LKRQDKYYDLFNFIHKKYSGAGFLAGTPRASYGAASNALNLRSKF